MAEPSDLNDIRHWGAMMQAASRCGLGKTAANTPIMAMEKFEDYFNGRLNKSATALNRAFDLERAVADYEQFKP
ncbi:MAG: hypothetical protein IPL65_09390 [Lewinellaceae bacterium]|nr:hypothetical protein [Lewinellaceae bacterium]